MTSPLPMRIAGISGSLRKDSFNSALLRQAGRLMPMGMSLEIVEIAGLPIFNEDIEKPFPEPVTELRASLARADALLIATPEYNSSLSGALKNALDWASRSPQPPLKGKPVGIIGTSTGVFGTVRAQLQLRQVLTHIGALTLTKPEVLIPRAEQAFDAEGNLIDPLATRFLGEFLSALADWITLVNKEEKNG